MGLFDGTGWLEAALGAVATVLGGAGLKFFFRIRLDARRDKESAVGLEASLGTYEQLIKENARLAAVNDDLDKKLNEVLAQKWKAEDELAIARRRIRELENGKKSAPNLGV